MAIFGDFGRVFQVATAPLWAPTRAVINITRGKSFTEEKTRLQREALPYIAGARLALSVFGKQKSAAPTPGQGDQVIYREPQDYFQPTQFSGGQYDPNIGGGYATWDSGTSWDWETPPPTYSEEGIWD